MAVYPLCSHLCCAKSCPQSLHLYDVAAGTALLEVTPPDRIGDTPTMNSLSGSWLESERDTTHPSTWALVLGGEGLLTSEFRNSNRRRLPPRYSGQEGGRPNHLARYGPGSKVYRAVSGLCSSCGHGTPTSSFDRLTQIHSSRIFLRPAPGPAATLTFCYRGPCRLLLAPGWYAIARCSMPLDERRVRTF